MVVPLGAERGRMAVPSLRVAVPMVNVAVPSCGKKATRTGLSDALAPRVRVLGSQVKMRLPLRSFFTVAPSGGGRVPWETGTSGKERQVFG